MRLRAAVAVGMLALVLGGCSKGQEEGSGGVQSSTAASPSTTVGSAPPEATTGSTRPTGTTGTSRGGSGGGGGGDDEGSERPDLLTIANGALVASATVGGEPAAVKALRVIDGSPSRISITTDAKPSAEFVFELPAATTFDRFMIPKVEEHPGNATFFKNIEISGSSESAEAGFTVLASAELKPKLKEETDVEITPTAKAPVRWVKVKLENGALIEHEPGSTAFEFSELIGNGTQDDAPLSSAFTGKWDYRTTDAPERAGPTLELKQSGSTVTGCVEDVKLTGTVTGGIARLQGHDTKKDADNVYIFGVTDAGELQGVESVNGSVFRAKFGPPTAANATSPCSDVQPTLPACSSIVYVNFDVGSAKIRSDSAQVITDLFEGLKATQGSVTIEGHTSTEGSDSDNLDLSKRRAQAVVDELVKMGMDSGRLASVGKGETEPLVNESDESGRAINRRVEVAC